MEMFKNTDKLIADFEQTIKNPILPINKQKLYVGVDLGTAYIVLTVLDENKIPIAGAYKFAKVVKDGLVLDFMGAINIVKDLKKEIEEKIGCELNYAAVAVPPGTGINDSHAVANVAEGAGFEVTNVVDEPTAANALLGIENGVVVDIGGGTTGLAIFKDGKVIYVADEATGGTQFSLVLAGANKITFEQAEILKQDPKKKLENAAVLRPVCQKVASIIKKHIQDFDVKAIYLVGGTSCLYNIEKVIESETGIKTYKPQNPLFVTPIGIAMNCKMKYEGDE
ncbi:ethanolamine utilization protein EutJ [Clostridium bowmanii]|uniref:ethanolamine utilization protein EutJ n=1 Tax=Clostridium bowmanii TaxID=132925 RepID=UPI001CD5DE99|nr:ethanolamine utilization protein EutJ [Clostridium bowmanii]MCA1075540.1 ethanolamine utilization protein EutJ [Clostridium bowmanii]